jgi:NADH dehydrogenase [ubiquinone] 1 alpha subcomplex assembly factor 6
LAQIKDLVSDSKLGLMRIQFWKDSLDKIYEGLPPHSPVAVELSKVVRSHRLTKRWLQRIIDARCDQITSDAPFESLIHVENFAESAYSAVNFLILEAAGVRNVHADHAASHIGKAQGITTLIRAVPYHARRRNVYLPMDLMIKHHLSQEDVIRGCREQKMKDLTYDMASEAHKHLIKADTLRKDLPSAARLALLPAVATRSFLKAVQRTDFDLFDTRLGLRNSWLPLTLLLSKFKGTF